MIIADDYLLCNKNNHKIDKQIIVTYINLDRSAKMGSVWRKMILLVTLNVIENVIF